MDNEFKLDSFLKDNYYLFAVMGIFGAISIYLNTINKDSPEGTSKDILQIGIIASLFLFIVVSLVILGKLFKNNDSEDLPLSFLTFNVGNIVRIFFAIPFFMLTITIYVYMSANFLEPFKVILSLVFYALGGLVLFGILGFIPLRLRNKGKAIILVCSLIIIVSTIAFQYIKNNLNDNYYLLFFFSSLVSGSFMVLVIIPISYLYDKLKEFLTHHRFY